jgi:hypothetical protein
MTVVGEAWLGDERGEDFLTEKRLGGDTEGVLVLVNVGIEATEDAMEAAEAAKRRLRSGVVDFNRLGPTHCLM